jgi:hypothetical protein
MNSKTLINLLDAIENCQEIKDCGVYDEGSPRCLNWGFLADRHHLVQQAVRCAEAVLIKCDGARDYDAEYEVSERGFFVFCAERDEFGWLSGGIETSKGFIAYG